MDKGAGRRRSAVGRLLGPPRVQTADLLRKYMKHDMKCTSSDVLASGQADNQLIEPCGCIFIIYYRLPDAFLHIVRHSWCQSLTHRLERISCTGCSPNRLKNMASGLRWSMLIVAIKNNLATLRRSFFSAFVSYAFFFNMFRLSFAFTNDYIAPKILCFLCPALFYMHFTGIWLQFLPYDVVLVSEDCRTYIMY